MGGEEREVGEVGELGLEIGEFGPDQRPFAFEVVDVWDGVEEDFEEVVRAIQGVVFWYLHGGFSPARERKCFGVLER